MKAKPTRGNVVFFALAFQIYPLLLWGLTTFVNPSPKTEGIVGIFAITQVVLISLIFTWIRKAKTEIHDEREAQVQLKVRSLMLNVATAVAIIGIFLNVSILHDLPAWSALGMILVWRRRQGSNLRPSH